MGWTIISNVGGMFPTFQFSPPWTASTIYFVSQTVIDSNGNTQYCTVGGTSGASVPSWNPTLGLTTSDGAVTWKNNGTVAVQKPSNALIQTFIDDTAGQVAAIIQRRFSEAIKEAGSFNAYLAAMGVPPPIGTDPTSSPWNLGKSTSSMQLVTLERLNRSGAAYQLGIVLSSIGVAGARDLAKHYDEADWKPGLADLNATDRNGKPLPFGQFDYLFDSQANISSPRPGLQAIAGGDQPSNAGPMEEGLSNFFGKFGNDFGPSALSGSGFNPLRQN